MSNDSLTDDGSGGSAEYMLVPASTLEADLLETILALK